MVRVIGIGLACLDYLLHVPDLRTVHRGCRLEGFKNQGGGLTATAMVAVARLGGQAELWTIIGQDHHGQLIEEELLEEGVDVSQIIHLDDRASAFNFILVDGRTGERVFLSPPLVWDIRGVEIADDLDWSRIDSADCLLVDAFWRPMALRGLKWAREKGVPTCADIGRIRGQEELLEFVDYLVVPQHAAEDIAGSPGPEALRALSAFGARMVAITLGPRGAIYLVGEEMGEVSAFRVEAVDTTGAGDVFHGAFAYGVGRGWAPRQLMLFSSAVAALKCTRLGGRTGIPDLAQTQRFLDKRMPDEDLGWLSTRG